jgi:two-component system nitrogen regulation response regulator GlnG
MLSEKKALDKILVVDDEESIRWVFEKGLGKKGYRVETFDNAEEAIRYFQKNPCPLVFMDIRLPGIDGLEAMERIKELTSDTFIVIITAQATMKNAIEAMKRGAYDYLVKPFDLEQVYLILHRVEETRKLIRQVSHLKGEVKGKLDVDELIGKSQKMQEVYKTIGKIADKEVTVLITGESGTGKELVAKILHYNNSSRASRPFVVVNCASIPRDLLESELFGHKKGAFTGAVKSSIGMFEKANGGTIFLDEIGDMDMSLQTKILRVLQEREFYRVGDIEPVRVDVRVIAATNRDLEEAIQRGQFREDLYYRLNVVPISLPPLRERKEDIPLLIDAFLKKFGNMGLGKKHLSPKARKLLLDNPWKGNVRELENVLKRAVVLASSNTIFPEDLPLAILDKGKIANEAAKSIEDVFEEKFRDFISKMCTLEKGNLYELLIRGVERPLITRVLAETNGNQIKAASILGINRNTLRKKIRELSIKHIRKKKSS